MNAFLAAFFVTQYLGGTEGAAAAPTPWPQPISHERILRHPLAG
jgi:hypothetical protein